MAGFKKEAVRDPSLLFKISGFSRIIVLFWSAFRWMACNTTNQNTLYSNSTFSSLTGFLWQEKGENLINGEVVQNGRNRYLDFLSNSVKEAG